MQKTFLFDKSPITAEQSTSPEGYTGLYGFHKYWGKKPHEPIAYVIEQLSQPGQLVVDPFLGSGTAARESTSRKRRFIGFDINPVAFELAQFITNPPALHDVLNGFRLIEKNIKSRIFETYALEDGTTATHYLWEGDELKQVWVKGNSAVARRELEVSAHDVTLCASFSNYRSRFVRCPKFFSNSRINASPDMTLESLLTPRAQFNLDLLIEAINECPESVRMPLRLCLTAASGQMTQMVFAVTGRGKTKGTSADKVEVGSWVIGYWRPRLHFEVNVWNCFENRVRKLQNALKRQGETAPVSFGRSVLDVVAGEASCYLGLADCRKAMRAIPDGAAQLVLTDPPHSDRVPYLELSEFWNSLLGMDASFEDEIVISNAKERNKTEADYHSSMRTFFDEAGRVLADDGHLVVLFNARQREAWSAIRDSVIESANSPLCYTGAFPCTYSALSVVQDNRKGALTSDWALVFSRSQAAGASCHASGISTIPGWTTSMPNLLSVVD